VRKFSDYMSEWLYKSEGYYTSFRSIGKDGDFYTAVSSSMFFGGSIAKRVISVIEEGFLPEDSLIVEVGAHKGYLLADMVQFIYSLRPDLLKSLRFAVVEPFEQNRVAQKNYFKDSFGDAVKFEIYEDFKNLKNESAFVVANEIFDAFSCELVKDEKMLYVKNDEFLFEKMDEFTKRIVKKYSISKGEVARGYEEFATTLFDTFKRYEFVSFDYGDLRKREDFSIRIYHKHQTIPFFALTDFVEDSAQKIEDISLEELFKKSDITYDVHFDHLIDAFKKSGAILVEFKTQLAMLVEFGIIELLELLQKNTDEKSYMSELNRAKLLIDPAFMGERFKGVIFRKTG